MSDYSSSTELRAAWANLNWTDGLFSYASLQIVILAMKAVYEMVEVSHVLLTFKEWESNY